MKKDYKQPDLCSSIAGRAARLHREFFFKDVMCLCTNCGFRG